MNDLPLNFIVIAKISQITDTLSEGLNRIKNKYPNNLPTNITSIKNFKNLEKENTNFLTYGSSAKIFTYYFRRFLMKDFYIRSFTAISYAIFLIFPLFYNEILFYIVGFFCSLVLVFEFIKLISNYNHKFFSSDTGKSNLILYLTFPLYISLFILSYNWVFQIFLCLQ